MNTTPENTKRKKNHFKSGKLERRRDLRRQEANNRAKNTSNFIGSKQKVKQGIITACEALLVVPANTKTGKWLEKKAKITKC